MVDREGGIGRMYERRSSYFASVFDSLDIGYTQDTSGRIDNNFALVFEGGPIRLYFNDATDERAAYFAVNESFYEEFQRGRWLDVRNARVEQTHLKWIPYPGEEREALCELLAFVTRTRGVVQHELALRPSTGKAVP